MIIKKASFVISNTNYKLCPNEKKAEYAFIGRSNVGKSSLINSLTNNKSLAKISAKPGKTQLINQGRDTTEHQSKAPGRPTWAP